MKTGAPWIRPELQLQGPWCCETRPALPLTEGWLPGAVMVEAVNTKPTQHWHESLFLVRHLQFDSVWA